MKLVKKYSSGVKLFKLINFKDLRGSFEELYNKNRYLSFGINDIFKQDNLSFSVHGSIRGLHYQIKKPQSKLVRVISGKILDVAVDIRINSKTFGKTYSNILSDENSLQQYIPKGFAHGFVTLSKSSIVLYKCSNEYFHEYERGIIWNDIDLKIDWMLSKNKIKLTKKNSKFPSFKESEKYKF